MVLRLLKAIMSSRFVFLRISWVHLEVLRPPWSHLDATDHFLGFGAILICLRPSWNHFELFQVAMRTSWGLLRPSWGHYEASFSHHCVILIPLRAIVGLGLPEALEGLHGFTLRVLKPFWRAFAVQLECGLMFAVCSWGRASYG